MRQTKDSRPAPPRAEEGAGVPQSVAWSWFETTQALHTHEGNLEQKRKFCIDSQDHSPVLPGRAWAHRAAIPHPGPPDRPCLPSPTLCPPQSAWETPVPPGAQPPAQRLPGCPLQASPGIQQGPGEHAPRGALGYSCSRDPHHQPRAPLTPATRAQTLTPGAEPIAPQLSEPQLQGANLHTSITTHQFRMPR